VSASALCGSRSGVVKHGSRPTNFLTATLGTSISRRLNIRILSPVLYACVRETNYLWNTVSFRMRESDRNVLKYDGRLTILQVGVKS
jgi:hypothetical protein